MSINWCHFHVSQHNPKKSIAYLFYGRLKDFLYYSMKNIFFGKIEVGGETMDVTKIWRNQRAELNITPRDLNEFDDPLDNILLDVMFESFYKRVQNLKSSKSDN